MDKLSTQKRVLLATLLSFVFFIVYDYFFIPKQVLSEQNATAKTQQITQKSAPSDTNINQAITTTKSDKILTKINAPLFEADIDELGRISKFYLNEAKYKNDDGSRTQLVSGSLMPLEIRFTDTAINEEAFKVPYVANVSEIDLKNGTASVSLTQNLTDLTITKNLTFYPNGKYDLEIKTSKNVQYYVTTGLRPSVAIDAYTVHGALLRDSEAKLEILEDGDVKAGGEQFANINILAASDRYYTTLFYSFDIAQNAVISTDEHENALVFLKHSGDLKINGYIGPKDYEILKSIDTRLTDVVEYGWFSFIAKPMFWSLSWLHSHIGNWGWAIVVLTLIIRVLLFPLTYKGMLSMNKLKELAPKMKEIQAKYKGDPQKLNVHMMELYKKHGANPMGGCLPILLQIPVFFAIYRVLLNAIELKGADWILWIHDLSVLDPYYVLPILMGATMFLQQKLTPTTFTDPMQEKIMKFLPLVFTLFFFTFPAGLTLYWFVNNLCSVIQQVVVNRLFEKHKKAEVKA